MEPNEFWKLLPKAVEIRKKNGGTRRLGIPTIDDRIAQMTAKLYVEPMLEPIFYENSYGYRPNKSAIDAVGMARQRCWKYDYVIDLDIKGLLDNINHELLPTDLIGEIMWKNSHRKYLIYYEMFFCA